MLTIRQITGLDSDHVQPGPDGCQIHPACADAFDILRGAAASEGFDLRIVSGFRGFERQLGIWNAKAQGTRPVHDDIGAVVDLSSLSDLQQVKAILRFSALPGASRHHWGSDLDVYDAAAVCADYKVALSLEEVASGGVFDPLHCWLDKYLDSNDNPGFFRPYDTDRGGVAPERWHLSYAPVAAPCQRRMSAVVLNNILVAHEFALREVVLGEIQTIYTRYVDLPEPHIPGFI